MNAAIMCNFTLPGKISKNTLMLSIKNFFRNFYFFLLTFAWFFLEPP